MVRLPLIAVLTAGVLLAAACGSPPQQTAVGAPLPEAPDCQILPDDSIWNTPVDALPVHPRSADWLAAIGIDQPAHPDFGSGTFDGGPIGIPYVTVGRDQPPVDVSFEFDDESDPGPYPIPPDPPIEGGPDSDGDRHVLIVDRDDCMLYELYDARPAGQAWTAGSGAVFDLGSNGLRPDTWTSADAAGLPILPGLVRYDEVDAGVIDHALRITAPRTDRSYVWPARHQAGAADDPSLPPMGARFRLSADVDPADFPAQARPIVTALRTYGAFLADNGSSWFISGAPDDRWDNDALRSLRQITGADWEAVQTESLQVEPDSGAARQPGGPTAGPGSEPPTPPEGEPTSVRDGGRLAGPDRIQTAVAIANHQFPDGATTVYLARADVVVDAVAGGIVTDGPILLVPSCGSLPTAVAAEIARLDPNRVIALGGQTAVCDDMLRQAREA